MNEINFSKHMYIPNEIVRTRGVPFLVDECRMGICMYVHNVLTSNYAKVCIAYLHMLAKDV